MAIELSFGRTRVSFVAIEPAFAGTRVSFAAIGLAFAGARVSFAAIELSFGRARVSFVAIELAFVGAWVSFVAIEPAFAGASGRAASGNRLYKVNFRGAGILPAHVSRRRDACTTDRPIDCPIARQTPAWRN